MDSAPNDYANPDWGSAGRTHDWKNYVSEEVRAMWSTFTDQQKAALARQSADFASREEWE